MEVFAPWRAKSLRAGPNSKGALCKRKLPMFSYTKYIHSSHRETTTECILIANISVILLKKRKKIKTAVRPGLPEHPSGLNHISKTGMVKA